MRAVFLLLGGAGDRDAHLHALSTIARCVSSPGFDLAWPGGEGEETLRQILLSGEPVDEYEEELQDG